MANETTVIIPTNESVAAQIVEALESVNTAITNLQTAITNVYSKSDVYTKAEVAAFHAVINASISAHTGSTSIHTSAQEKETWNAKLDSTTGYTRTQSDSMFAAKSIEPTVASLQTEKADKADTYTKSQVNTLVANITESGGDMNHADFTALEDATAADTIGALKAKYNALLAICKGVTPVVAMASLLMACGDALALTSSTVFDDISGTNTIGEVVKAGGLAAQDVHARPDDWMPTAADVGAVAVGANGGVEIGYDTTASGVYSHAEGSSTTAFGDYSHAEGFSTIASGNYSHAEGVKANANENYSFSWNGDETTTYNSHGMGTFNLNPIGGLSGLWIGESTLETILGGYANITTTYAPTNALVSLNQSVQYVTADSNGSAVEILAPTNSMKDWVVYIYSMTNNAVLFPTGTVYAADATVTNALNPNVVTALYLSSYPAVPNGLIVGRQEMNPIVIVR